MPKTSNKSIDLCDAASPFHLHAGRHYGNERLRRRPPSTPRAISRGRRRRAEAGQPAVAAVGVGIALGVRGAMPTATLGVENALGIAHFLSYADGIALGIAHLFILIYSPF